MQHSKSLGSFSSGSNTLALGQRPKARSSLDTFVIPGRTRIPSSKPEAFDLQIAETLVNSAITRPTRDSLDDMSSSSQRKKQTESQRLSNTSGAKSSQSPKAARYQPRSSRGRGNQTPRFSRKESGSLYTLQSRSQKFHKVRSEISKRPPPQIGGHDIIIIPPRRTRKLAGNPSPKPLRPPLPRKVTLPTEQSREGYDGAFGSSYDSRTTSMTWSTVSHRILTDSSRSFQGLQASESLDEFNRLAVKHGIPEMEKCSDDESIKITEKIHHHNWLARKLFHRTSSTYTLKMKNDQRRLKQKKSFRRIPKLEDPDHKNILKDRSLEEVCRLGGIGLLALPDGFSVVKQLSLPTCLSATATYLLQHGTNHPGLFRVSGQSSTVNALYEFYAFQFAQAGSPSKVQETVGIGILPAHIEHSVPDVASLFKKILNALPGGLLGSLELFEAFRNVFFRLTPGPELSEADTRMLQAKLIALAISSVTSTQRASLIQAVLGLVAYFGDEAEVARKNSAVEVDGHGEKMQPSFELMGFQALGVVMGPLMLGNLIDQLDPILSPDNEDHTRTSSDNTKKADKKTEKKQKRPLVGNKLDRDATLSVHVDRANISANVMELLLIIWKDVILQLRELLPGASSTSIRDAARQLRRARKGDGSRNYLGNSEEEMLFMDMIKRRPLRADYSEEFKMKRKIKVGRSVRARGARRASSDSLELPTTLASSGEHLVGSVSKPFANSAAAINNTGQSVRQLETSTPGSLASNSPGAAHSIREDQRTKSDLAMAQMSMGTILPRLEDSPVTPLHKEMLRSVSQPQTPMVKSQQSEVNRSSSVVPKTALRNLPISSRDSHRLMEQSQSSLERLQIPTGNNFQIFPPRITSLPTEICTKNQPQLHSLEPTQPASASDPSGASKSRRRSSAASGSQTTNEAGSNQAMNGSLSLSKSSKQGIVKVLAQHFDDPPRTSTQAGSMHSKAPIAHGEFHALSSPKTFRVDDPFSFSGTSHQRSPEKASRIPKPARELGSARNDHSSSSSPSKSPKDLSAQPRQLVMNGSLKTCPSSFQLTADMDPDLINENDFEKSEKTEARLRSATSDGEHNVILEGKSDDTVLRASDPQHYQNEIGQTTITRLSRDPPSPPRRAGSKPSHRGTNSSVYLEVATTRPLSAYSVESLRRIHLAGEPPVAQHIPPRNTPTGGHVDEALEDADTAAELGSNSLRHSGSVNTAMAVEIYHLKYLLEQKEKDVRETRRSLDAMRDSREDSVVTGNDGVRGSVSKGTLANELRNARKETAEWKRRAQWAEGRLAVIGQQSKGETGQTGRKKEPSQAKEEKPQFWLHE